MINQSLQKQNENNEVQKNERYFSTVSLKKDKQNDSDNDQIFFEAVKNRILQQARLKKQSHHFYSIQQNQLNNQNIRNENSINPFKTNDKAILKIKEQKDICIAIQQFQSSAAANKSVSTASASNFENKTQNLHLQDNLNKKENQQQIFQSVIIKDQSLDQQQSLQTVDKDFKNISLKQDKFIEQLKYFQGRNLLEEDNENKNEQLSTQKSFKKCFSQNQIDKNESSSSTKFRTLSNKKQSKNRQSEHQIIMNDFTVLNQPEIIKMEEKKLEKIQNNAGSIGDRMKLYQNQRLQRLEILIKQKEEREMIEVKSKPLISKRSIQLVNKKKQNPKNKSNMYQTLRNLNQIIGKQSNKKMDSDEGLKKQVFQGFIAHQFDIQSSNNNVQIDEKQKFRQAWQDAYIQSQNLQQIQQNNYCYKNEMVNKENLNMQNINQSKKLIKLQNQIKHYNSLESIKQHQLKKINSQTSFYKSSTIQLKNKNTQNPQQKTKSQVSFHMPLQLMYPELTLHPKINEKSKKIQRDISDLFKWHEQVKQKHQMQREQKQILIEREESIMRQQASRPSSLKNNRDSKLYNKCKNEFKQMHNSSGRQSDLQNQCNNNFMMKQKINLFQDHDDSLSFSNDDNNSRKFQINDGYCKPTLQYQMNNLNQHLNFFQNENTLLTVHSENILTTTDNRFNGPENINNSAQSQNTYKFQQLKQSEPFKETEKKLNRATAYGIKPKHMICMYENDDQYSPFNQEIKIIQIKQVQKPVSQLSSLKDEFQESEGIYYKK